MTLAAMNQNHFQAGHEATSPDWLFEDRQKEPDRLFISFLEQAVSKIPLPWYLSWFFVSVAFFLVHCVLLALTSSSNPYMVLELIWSLTIAWIVIETIWSCKAFERLFPYLKAIIDVDEPSFRAWYVAKLKAMFSSRGMWITGFLFIAVFETIIIKYAKYGHWLDTELLMYYEYLFLSICLLATGSSQYSFYSLSIFVSRFARLPFKRVIYTYSAQNLTEIGKLLFKIGAGGVGLICLYTSLIVIGPFQQYHDLYFVPLVFLIGAIFWFFITQNNIHQMLIAQKHFRIDASSVHIERAIEEALRSPTSEMISRIDELRILHSEINKMPVWSFDFKTVVSYLTTVIIPAVMLIIEIVFKFLG